MLLFSEPCDVRRGVNKSNFFPSSLLPVVSNGDSVKKLGRSTSKLKEAFISFSLGAFQISIGIFCSLLFETSKTVSEGSLNNESGRKSNLKKKDKIH